MLAKRLDRIEQRLLAFDSLDKILDTIDQNMAMMVHRVQPSRVLSSMRNSNSVSKSHALAVNPADSSVKLKPLGVSLDDIPSTNIPTTLTHNSVALMSLVVNASPTSPPAAVEVTSLTTRESAEYDAKLGVTSSSTSTTEVEFARVSDWKTVHPGKTKPKRVVGADTGPTTLPSASLNNKVRRVVFHVDNIVNDSTDSDVV